MNKNQEDTLNMYETVSDVLHAHEAVWSTNVPFSEDVDTLDASIDAIGNLAEQQDEDTTGVTEDKKNKRTTLEDLTITIAGALVSFASRTNNRELVKKVNFTRTDLERARDNELPTLSGQVHQEAALRPADLLPYGITPVMITALETAIEDFMEYISKPRAAKGETKSATEQLPGVFTETDKVLEERLDTGMEIFRSNTDFYNQYFNARTIVNSPTQKRALEVKFEDSVTHAPIEHVKVLVDGTINRRSSEKGIIRVQSLSEGAHSLATSLPGYADASQNFNVITGETTKLVIMLTAV